MASEQFLSAPNLMWFGLGIAAEFFFLGFGITPAGMNMAAEIAGSFGMVDTFNAASGIANVGVPGVLDTLDFGIK